MDATTLKRPPDVPHATWEKRLKAARGRTAQKWDGRFRDANVALRVRKEVYARLAEYGATVDHLSTDEQIAIDALAFDAAELERLHNQHFRGKGPDLEIVRAVKNNFRRSRAAVLAIEGTVRRRMRRGEED